MALLCWYNSCQHWWTRDLPNSSSHLQQGWTHSTSVYMCIITIIVTIYLLAMRLRKLNLKLFDEFSFVLLKAPDHGRELRGFNGSVPKLDYFVKGIMDENVLCLCLCCEDYKMVEALWESSTGDIKRHSVLTLTAVWTNCVLCSRIPFINPYTSIVVKSIIRNIKESKAMKVPVRPTPALQCTNRGALLLGGCDTRTRRMNATSRLDCCGTPWSGQTVYWKWVTFKGGASHSELYMGQTPPAMIVVIVSGIKQLSS